MENKETINRSYCHVAFKIKGEGVDYYLNKINSFFLEMKSTRPRIQGEGISIYFYDYDNRKIILLQRSR